MSGCVARWHKSRCILDRVHSGPHMLAGGEPFPETHVPASSVIEAPTSYELPSAADKELASMDRDKQLERDIEYSQRGKLPSTIAAREHAKLIEARDALAESIEANLKCKVGAMQLMRRFADDHTPGEAIDASPTSDPKSKRILRNFCLDLANNAVQGLTGLLLP